MFNVILNSAFSISLSLFLQHLFFLLFLSFSLYSPCLLNFPSLLKIVSSLSLFSSHFLTKLFFTTFSLSSLLLFLQIFFHHLLSLSLFIFFNVFLSSCKDRLFRLEAHKIYLVNLIEGEQPSPWIRLGLTPCYVFCKSSSPVILIILNDPPLMFNDALVARSLVTFQRQETP